MEVFSFYHSVPGLKYRNDREGKAKVNMFLDLIILASHHEDMRGG
jgi:hypothetical protein